MYRPVITDREVHRRTITAQFNRCEVIEVLTRAAIDQAGIKSLPTGSDVKVTFEDETEGSPAYRVGTKAKVVITIDLAPPPPTTGPTEG